MSFLDNYRGEHADRQPPPRVYACVDSIEPIEPGGDGGADIPPDLGVRRPEDDLVLLDSVDADWFDRTEGSLVELSDEADWNVSVIATTRTALEPFVSHELLAEGAWLEVSLDPPRLGAGALHYLNLYGPPDEQSIRSVRPLPDLDPELARRTSMDQVADASEEELERALPRFRVDGAAAYDVGQGNCNALLQDGVPRLYFDFGGGVIGNRRSFPAALQAFCLGADPTIVLSHWDWDHWSSANRQPDSYEQTWIVPRQQKTLRPVHATFLGRLLRHRRVLVWPDSLQILSRGDYRLIKCLGSPRSTNDSGLALIAEHHAGNEKLRMLFPGDACYDYIPSSCDTPLVALVAAHHGANVGARQIPQPAGDDATLVYSYGAGNSYPHPSPAGRAVHSGWQHVLETAHRNPDLGHAHLYWHVGASDATPPCGGNDCQLTCHQR
ncbi:MAG TPA: hypothetical protein VGL78_10385 [Solirubrobacteraceae bacterium]|jgi:hypothetical protein